MRCNIIWTDPKTGNEILENVRHTDEIIEAFGLSETDAARFELEMKRTGRYHLDKDRCVWPARDLTPMDVKKCAKPSPDILGTGNFD